MFKKLFLILTLALPMWAALPTTTIYEVHQAGNDTNGGCFIEGATGTDRSQQNSPQIVYTDLVAATGSTITSAGFPFTSAEVGNCLRITGGSGWTTGLYQIVSVTTGTATVDRTIATMGSTSGAGNLGGALATITQLNTDMCSGCRAYIKADGIYTTGAQIAPSFSNSGAAWWEGYTTTRGDNGQFTLKATSGSGFYMLVYVVSAHFIIRNIILDANSTSGVNCLAFNSSNSLMFNMECKNWTSSGQQILFNAGNSKCMFCYFHDGNQTGNQVVYINNAGDACYACVIRNVSGSSVAFYLDAGTCEYCVVDGMTGTGAFGMTMGNQNDFAVDHAVIYNVVAECVHIISPNPLFTFTNGILSTCADGFKNTSGTTLRPGDQYMDYNAVYNMTGSNYVAMTAGPHDVTLSADPFVSASTHDFRLNTTAGGGAAVRAVGTPSAILGILSTFYPDMGVAQHQDSGGGGSAGGSSVVAQ